MAEEGKILQSIYPDEDVPENLTIPGFFRLNCREETLNKIFQICSDTGVKYTRREVLDQTGRFASALKNGNFGLDAGDHVGIFLPNVPEYFSIIMGIWEAGLVAVLVNPAYTTYELEPILQNAGIKIIITLPENLEKMNSLAEKLGIKTVVTLGDGDENDLEYFKLIRQYSPLNADPYGDGNKLACVVFSSGTSGTPKGVKISHCNLISQLFTLDGVFHRIKEDEVMLSMFPRFHIAGVLWMLIEFHRSSTLVGMQTKFTPLKFVLAIKKHKPTVMALAPTLVSIIASSSELGPEDFRQLTTVLCGGAVLGSVLLEKFRAKVGPGVIFQSAYGFSECGFLTSMPNKQSILASKAASVGLVLSNAEVKVVDTKTSLGLGPNQGGEICMRGISLFQGYLNNEEATSIALDTDGWYHSGDFGHYDDRGYLYIDGRIKDLIKVNSFQVSPEEIENMVMKHDKVSQVVVFGIPYDKYQEVPRAMIVPKDSSLTEEEIQEFLKDKLMAYKQLRGGIRFVDSLPTNAAGKVVRRDAKELDTKLCC